MKQTEIRKKLVIISLMEIKDGEAISKKVNELIEQMDSDCRR
jgi:hypothetical protein